jgi:hypothetical protein
MMPIRTFQGEVVDKSGDELPAGIVAILGSQILLDVEFSAIA